VELIYGITRSRQCPHGAKRMLLAAALVVWMATAGADERLVSGASTATSPASKSGAEIALHALSFLGVRYKFGGTDPRGFDCSGLVRHVFQTWSGMELPRRAADMRRSGRPVGEGDLAPGDLVFFNTRGRPFSHVAIYIGDRRFVHAPAFRGEVRVNSMDERYWRARFNGARRLLGLDLRKQPEPVRRGISPAEPAESP
jgi:cell wall-associated NlpC family hydrolase